MNHVPMRQIHLDCHTSEHITDVMAQFDPEQFADRLAAAHVQSVNLFARCWHGWLYFDSKRFPDEVHPHLVRRTLLADQMRACHQRSIRTPIYVGVQMASAVADRRPEWRQISIEGKLAGSAPMAPGHRGPLCLNTALADFMEELVDELFELMPRVDGFWFDGVSGQDCVCHHCRAGMQSQGIDPRDERARRQYGLDITAGWIQRMSRHVRSHREDVSIFYNAGHLGPADRRNAAAYTHFDVETIPFVEGWGFMHGPSVTRYIRTLGKPVCGMTGKFHTNWGDLHSYRSRAALEYECFHMLALGSGCCIGDHLHPGGTLDRATYELIGSVYEQVRSKEPWCIGARPVSEIAVLSPESTGPRPNGENQPPQTSGTVRMLQELGMQFDVVDQKSALEGYTLVVLPDTVALTAECADRLDRHLDDGGAILSSGYSATGLHGAGLAGQGLTDAQPAAFDTDYVLAEGPIGKGLPQTEHTMYLRATQAKPRAGTRVLCSAVRPLFCQDGPRYAGERSSGVKVYPAVTQKGSCVHFAHPVFEAYHRYNAHWMRTMVGNAIGLLIAPLLTHDGPSTLIATVTEQADQRRFVIHLLHYIPSRFGALHERIDDAIPLHDIGICFRTDRSVEEVVLVPDGQPLQWRRTDERIEFTVPEVHGHQMVTVAYGSSHPA